MKKFLTKKVIIIAAGALAAMGTGAALLTSPGKSVATITVSEQLLADTFWEDGMVKAETRSVVSADITGKILSIAVKEGQSVKKGDVLLTLDTRDLESERAKLIAEKMRILAAWEQSRDQTKQQIAAIEAQKAGANTANTQKIYAAQIAILEHSLDPTSLDSVAMSFEQMLALTAARWQFINAEMVNASRQTPAEVQALQTQLETAKAQQSAIDNQLKQYELQSQQNIITDPTDPSFDQVLFDAYKAVLDSYSQMLTVANGQVSRLQGDLSSAQSSVPQTIETLRAQQLALESERSTLEEQYKQYRLTTQSQILSLSAQQEQAAAVAASEKKLKSKLGEQIDLLAQSMTDDSSSASYYAAQIAQIDASLADTERSISLASVVSPIDGVVGALGITEGEYMQAGRILTEVVDPSSLRVECMLLTNDADSVSGQTEARVVWEKREGDVSYPGKIQRISALAVNAVSAVGLNEQRVKVTLLPDFPPDIHPRDGYEVRVQFTTASQNALWVPRSAVVETDKGDAVYVIRDGRATLTEVELGLDSGERIAVLSGLVPNDIVVQNPETDEVKDQLRIKNAE